MLNQRLEAINGGKRLTLAQMKKHAVMTSPQGEGAYETAVVDRMLEMSEEATRKKVMDEMKLVIKALEEKVKSTEKAKDAEMALHMKMCEQLQEQNGGLKESLNKLMAEASVTKEKYERAETDYDAMDALHKSMLRDMETKLSQTFGKLAQSEKQNRELRESAKPVPAPVVVHNPMPSFKFTPVKDRNGNIVAVNATPIGA